MYFPFDIYKCHYVNTRYTKLMICFLKLQCKMFGLWGGDRPPRPPVDPPLGLLRATQSDGGK